MNAPELRARKLVEKIMETWQPPQIDWACSVETVAQTASMLAIAYIYGQPFLGELTANQQSCITEGLAIYGRLISPFEDN